MIAMLDFATLVVFTIFAAAAAFAFDWMLLQAMFVLMKPATARRAPTESPVPRENRQLAGAYASDR